MSREIEDAISREDWNEARRLIRADLREDPDNHWLLTRLSLTYYEQFDYQQALDIAQKAFALAPQCPLVLWDRAGALDMLGRRYEAIELFRKIARRDVKALATGDCGEGVAWARGLVADCWYRIGGIHRKDGRRRDAVRCYRRHLELRGPHCRSIYAIQSVRRELRECSS